MRDSASDSMSAVAFEAQVNGWRVPESKLSDHVIGASQRGSVVFTVCRK